MNLRALGRGRMGELREIHMGREVRLAGLGQRIGEGVALSAPGACRRRPAPSSRNR